MSKGKLVVLLLAAVISSSVPSSAADRFMRPVNAGASSPFTSWATAATNFSQLTAVWQDGDVIWLATGVYHNTQQAVIDRGVTIKGFGSRESTFINGGGWLGFQLQHSNAVVEGLTITNCWHPDSGSAVYIYMGGTVRNCTLTSNTSGSGGAIFLDQGGVVDGCLVTGNAANRGGGIGCGYGGTIINSTITLNRASGGGGGVDMNRGGLVSNCVIAENHAGPSGDGGGGVRTYYGGTVLNSLIATNTASYGTSDCRGGGVSLYYEGVLSNCTIVGNMITVNGGGVYLYQCTSGGVFNCTIINNAATNASSGRGGGIYCYDAGAVANCTIAGNSATNEGGGVWCNAAGCGITNCTISANWATYQGGGVALQGAGNLAGCVITGNMSMSGGGIYSGGGGRIARCVINGNTAFGSGSGDGGGGIYFSGHYTNCLIVGNTASNRGGGVYMMTPVTRLYYCTISGNTASNGGGVFRAGDQYALENCIVFGNYASTVYSNYALTGNNSTNYFASYSCLAPAPTGTAGLVGNRYEDPLFRNPGAGNYELGTNSPCIDTAGSSTAPRDLKGVRRALDGNGDGTNSYDMGAYEFTSHFSDSDHDGINDQTETRIGTDPLSNNTDGDDADDNYEHITGTDPTGYTAASNLFRTQLGSLGTGPFHMLKGDPTGRVVVSWVSVTGRIYSVVSSTNLLSTWSDTTFTNVPGTGSAMSYESPAIYPSENLTLRIWLTEDP